MKKTYLIVGFRQRGFLSTITLVIITVVIGIVGGSVSYYQRTIPASPSEESTSQELPEKEVIHGKTPLEFSGPRGCRSQAECEVYCSSPKNLEECTAFAKKEGIQIKLPEEKSTARRTGPGGCRSEAECAAYCSDPAHLDECVVFGGKEEGSTGALSSLSSCGAKSELFSVSPVALSDISGIVPLGSLNPKGGHVFPTRHLYFYIAPYSEVSVASPGDIRITNITTKEYFNQGTTDYSIEFSPCKEFTAYFHHITSISQKIKDKLAERSGSCNEYTTGNFRIRQCRSSMNLEIKAGEPIGGAGGGQRPAALDFGVSDSRTPQLRYANPKRWSDDLLQLHMVCAIDYFSSGLRKSLEAKLGEYNGNTPRATPPICGEVEQDMPGTAQGIWFLKGATRLYPEDPHLSLVHDNVLPERGVFSVGTSMAKSGLAVESYYFVPTRSGFVNREFSDVIADNNMYCYELQDRFSGYSMGTVILQLTSPITLRIEKYPSSSCGSGPWAFGQNYTDFER